MLREFLMNNRSELIDRCRAKVSSRHAPRAPPAGLERPHAGDTAAGHGKELPGCDFSIDQVVHDYGDLCRSIVELAAQQAAPITADELVILNARLDNVGAGEATESAPRRETTRADEGGSGRSERLAALAHELRNLLNTTIVATAAIKAGSVGFNGATAAALDRSLAGIREVIDRVLTEVRLDGLATPSPEVIEIGAFLVDVQVDAALAAIDKRCELTVLPVEPGILVETDRHVLASAVASLLRNAFEHTRSNTDVVLRAYSSNGRVLFEVEDECGGRPDAEGVGAELLLRRRGIEANGGRIYARSVDRGCVFTIELPRKN